MEDNFSDTLVTDNVAHQELREYDEGRFEYYGESLDVVLTDDAESRRLRSTEFGR